MSTSRRDFLKLTGTGLIVWFSTDAIAGQETARPQTGRQGYPTDVNAYLHIGADGKVTDDTRIRAALRNCGIPFKWDRRITVNLAPADLRKEGTGFDLPIAVALLAGIVLQLLAPTAHESLLGALGPIQRLKKMEPLMVIKTE